MYCRFWREEDHEHEDIQGETSIVAIFSDGYAWWLRGV
jgi:hypothetical protein